MVFYLLYMYSVSGQGEYEAENIHRLEVSPQPEVLDVEGSDLGESFEYRPTENDDKEMELSQQRVGDVWGQKDGNKIKLRDREQDEIDKQDTLKDYEEDDDELEDQFEI